MKAYNIEIPEIKTNNISSLNDNKSIKVDSSLKIGEIGDNYTITLNGLTLGEIDVNSKLDKTGGTISGDLYITGDLNVESSITGYNLYVNGDLRVKDENGSYVNILNAIKGNTVNLDNKVDKTGDTITGDLYIDDPYKLHSGNIITNNLTVNEDLKVKKGEGEINIVDAITQKADKSLLADYATKCFVYGEISNKADLETVNTNSRNISALYTNFNDHIKSDIHLTKKDRENINSISSRALNTDLNKLSENVKNIEDDVKSISSSVKTKASQYDLDILKHKVCYIDCSFKKHVNDDKIHVTEDEKNYWNAKLDKIVVQQSLNDDINDTSYFCGYNLIHNFSLNKVDNITDEQRSSTKAPETRAVVNYIDSNYINNSNIDTIELSADNTHVPSSPLISTLLSTFSTLKMLKVEADEDGKPDVTDPKQNIIYLVKKPNSNTYIQWIWYVDETTTGTWMELGSTDINLDNYFKTENIDTNTLSNVNTNVPSSALIISELNNKQDNITTSDTTGDDINISLSLNDASVLASSATLNKAESISENENKVPSAGLVYEALLTKANESDLSNHIDDTNIHVSSDEKNIWYNKQDAITPSGDNGDDITTTLSFENDKLVSKASLNSIDVIDEDTASSTKVPQTQAVVDYIAKVTPDVSNFVEKTGDIMTGGLVINSVDGLSVNGTNDTPTLLSIDKGSINLNLASGTPGGVDSIGYIFSGNGGPSENPLLRHEFSSLSSKGLSIEYNSKETYGGKDINKGTVDLNYKNITLTGTNYDWVGTAFNENKVDISSNAIVWDVTTNVIDMTTSMPVDSKNFLCSFDTDYIIGIDGNKALSLPELYIGEKSVAEDKIGITITPLFTELNNSDIYLKSGGSENIKISHDGIITSIRNITSTISPNISRAGGYIYFACDPSDPNRPDTLRLIVSNSTLSNGPVINIKASEEESDIIITSKNAQGDYESISVWDHIADGDKHVGPLNIESKSSTQITLSHNKAYNVNGNNISITPASGTDISNKIIKTTILFTPSQDILFENVFSTQIDKIVCYESTLLQNKLSIIEITQANIAGTNYITAVITPNIK